MAANTSLTHALRVLITANHILYHHSLVDAFGHISVRDPLEPSKFYMSAMLAPALVSSPADLVQYHVCNGSAVDAMAPEGYRERYIHSEILRRYPDVNSVIHSHANDVLPFTIAQDVGLQSAFHMAGFIGDCAPVFDVADHYVATDSHDLLVSNTRLGAVLASDFASPPRTSSSASSPTRTLVLMRGHGFTTLGPDVETAVFRAFYIVANARLQSAAMSLSAQAGIGRVRYLDAQERTDAGATNRAYVLRAWWLWVREVRTAGALYANALGWPEQGMRNGEGMDHMATEPISCYNMAPSM